MGGVEFGGPLLASAEVTVSSGNANLKLTFRKSAVTIYGITCDTFIDTNPGGSANGQGIQAGTIGYYDKNGNLNTSNVTTTLSADTALNSANEAVHYATSMSFPLDCVTTTYQLTLYVNSNVMGMQFGAGSYPATLTIDWSNVPNIEVENNSSGGNGNSTGNTGASKNTGSTGNNGNTNSTTSNSSGSAGTAGNASTSGSTGAESVGAGSTDAGSTNTGESSNNAGNAETAGEDAITQDADTSATKDAVEAIEKKGLNIYYADGEENGKADAVDESDSNTGKIIIGIVAVCIVGAVGTAAVIFRKKLKRKEQV